MLEVIKKISLANKESKKAFNQMAAYETDQQIKKLIDELVVLHEELERKQNTPITHELLEKNGFEVAISRAILPFKTWRLKANPAFWFDEYEEDRNYLDDGEFGLVKKGAFLLWFANKRVDINTAADIEDVLTLCGIHKALSI